MLISYFSTPPLLKDWLVDQELFLCNHSPSYPICLLMVVKIITILLLTRESSPARVGKRDPTYHYVPSILLVTFKYTSDLFSVNFSQSTMAFTRNTMCDQTMNHLLWLLFYVLSLADSILFRYTCLTFGIDSLFIYVCMYILIYVHIHTHIQSRAT